MRNMSVLAVLFSVAALASAGCGGHTAGCSSNADCTSIGVCDLATHTCVGCVTSKDCAAGAICVANMCLTGCDDTHGCGDGMQCDPGSHQCVGCVDNSGCSSPNADCDPSTHMCVPCLVGAMDDCAKGSYCSGTNGCVQGCKSDGDCTGGTCMSDHSCSLCHADTDCAQGKVCANGACMAACDSTANPCPSGGTCCGGHCFDAMSDNMNCGGCGNVCKTGTTCCGGQCVDTTSDAKNCGACGKACGAGSGCCAGACASLTTQTNCGACGNVCQNGDFCDSSGTCQHPTYPNFCKNNKVVEIDDPYAGDDAAAHVMSSTVKANCQSGVMLTVGNSTDPALVNQSTGEPVAGAGVTYVTTGGPVANPVLAWLEDTRDLTKVYWTSNGLNTFYWKLRNNCSGNGCIVAQEPSSMCGSSYDQFIVELVTNPDNGTLSLIGYGACAQGTRASAWYFANVMLKNPSQFPDSWYVVSWSDATGDGQPDPADTFKVLAHGM